VVGRNWDPLQDVLVLQERMNRLFEESLARGRGPDSPLGSGWMPLADVYETADSFVVEVELPGLSEEDVIVQVDGDELRLRGERRSPTRERPDSFYRMERSYGAFTRSFKFPEEIDPERVNAQFLDGLLRLELCKQKSRARR
jgi:HSP20 family protein